ncbi:T9SS type B sorting domain-containing protein [Mariniflexile sp. AS56]|uniref:T9SS type B sorting domain-containing protein n=1 Tax=Mariniflexile sp. AS56 TaxID=3063957 RepID=UPI0026EB3F6C|nr:T9SS type B sorting domain-containing protein [Mariniflexile sp. AS56]MDO7172119.1 T9SS type B sorting domain-containing protein [Mariniflexile sp. AS56]
MWLNKTLIYGLFLTLTSVITSAQNTAIPDPNFEQVLIDIGLDTAPINGLVPTANINTITNLDVAGKNILDLTGIEAFTALQMLDCSVNLLTSLNVSNNTSLKELYIYNNQIPTINLSLLTDLKILWCFSNILSNLNVNNQTELISLVCWDNNLSSLNTSNNTKLNVLVCDNNNISTLDVSKNTTLSRFQCGTNLISNLDVSNNLNLSYLSCENNQLTTLNVNVNNSLNTLYCQFNALTALDVSNNKSLIFLDCSNNQLCELNVKNTNNSNATVNFSSNLNLNCVVVDNPTGTHTNWLPAGFSNYVSNQDQCSNFVNIDRLESVITNTLYTLPGLTYGNYFTETGGQGTPLFPGENINTSQTIYIYNESVCATNESNFTVLITSEAYYIPKYFTPNNDGVHDVWKVQDFNNSIKNIAIYNRYGKLLKYLPANTSGWNGIFNGKLLETNDYWYAITLHTGETITGHFVLKR